MKREEYCISTSVVAFISWLAKRLDQENSFIHSYVNAKSKEDWYCDSIYSAFQNYNWRFSYLDKNGRKISGNTFTESKRVLVEISADLHESIYKGNENECFSACRQILEWGGVTNKNLDKIRTMEKRCSYFKHAIEIFELDNDLDYYVNSELIMNSGFTKIYSLIVRDFIIYDSRVGATLGLLVRKFCEENQIKQIPGELIFSWGIKRQGSNTYMKTADNPRNPSVHEYKFPMLTNNSKVHIDNNMRANWLLNEVLKTSKSKFNSLEEMDALRALESAFFMIGYEVKAK